MAQVSGEAARIEQALEESAHFTPTFNTSLPNCILSLVGFKFEFGAPLAI